MKELGPHLDAILRGEELPWDALGTHPADLLDACRRQDLSELVHYRVAAFRHALDWPEPVLHELEKAAYASAATELMRRQEIVSVLNALAASDVYPVLFKGAALAHTVYEAPSLRPHRDVDLLIRREQVETARQVMAELGYAETLLSGGELVMCQFELARTDEFGLDHAFDFHWKISTQSVFAETLIEEELASAAVPIPSLGPHARAVGPVHALLLACMHPVMHHRNTERAVWIFDVHLIASGLSDAEWDRFAALAIDKRVAAVCALRLALARSHFRTRLPGRVVAGLDEPRPPEPSEVYLRPSRRWHHDLLSSLRGLGRPSDRARLLREVLVPSPRYMLRSYGFGAMGFVLLPALYVHRVMHGVWRVLRGRK